MPDGETRPLEGIAGQRVLITGGRGFIGSAVCRSLREQGADVFTLGRTPPEQEDPEALVGDLASYEQTLGVMAEVRPHAVLHLASHVLGARTMDVVLSTFHSNLTSTVNLLAAAREQGCPRVVLTGSLEEPDPSPAWPVPSSPYAAAKFAASSYGRMFHALYELPVSILRVFMVYGPGQHDRRKLVPYVIDSLLAGTRPQLGSGTREVDWIYVDDVVDAFVRSLVAPGIDGLTIDVGSGVLTSVRDVVEQIHERLGAEPPAFGGIPDRTMEQVRVADVRRSQELLGWSAQTSLTDGLSATIDWCRRTPIR